MWATMQGPDQQELREALTRAELIDRPGARWHYSNLGYAILGQIVEEVAGATCTELIDRDLLPASVVAAMQTPQVMVDRHSWNQAMTPDPEPAVAAPSQSPSRHAHRPVDPNRSRHDSESRP
jgi:hypothetical protein